MGLMSTLFGLKSADEKDLIKKREIQLKLGNALFHEISSAASRNIVFNKDDKNQVNKNVINLESGKNVNDNGEYTIVVKVNKKRPEQDVYVVYVRINASKDIIGLTFGRLAEKVYSLTNYSDLVDKLKDYIIKFSDQGKLLADTVNNRERLFHV